MGEKAGGLDSASDYPDSSHIDGRTLKCKRHFQAAVKVTSFAYATKPCTEGSCHRQDEGALKRALAQHGPVSVCVNAGDWQNYRGGIYKRRCSGASDKLDHCVQLVGYDSSRWTRTPFWIVRNSWNT